MQADGLPAVQVRCHCQRSLQQPAVRSIAAVADVPRRHVHHASCVVLGVRDSPAWSLIASRSAWRPDCRDPHSESRHAWARWQSENQGRRGESHQGFPRLSWRLLIFRLDDMLDCGFAGCHRLPGHRRWHYWLLDSEYPIISILCMLHFADASHCMHCAIPVSAYCIIITTWYLALPQGIMVVTLLSLMRNSDCLSHSISRFSITLLSVHGNQQVPLFACMFISLSLCAVMCCCMAESAGIQ